MGGSFWQKNSLITLILFELQPIIIFSSGANFGHHPLCKYTYISCGESGNEFPDNFEFTTEEGVFVLLELVFVHAKEIKVDSGNGFDETFERGGELELPEEAGGNASGGGAGQTDLQILRSISNFTSFFFKLFSADSHNFRFRSYSKIVKLLQLQGLMLSVKFTIF